MLLFEQLEECSTNIDHKMLPDPYKLTILLGFLIIYVKRFKYENFLNPQRNMHKKNQNHQS